jgi:hypothetical protein
MIFISDVIQKVEDMQKQKTVPSSAVIQFLSNIDLSHVLPSKAPTTARKFMVCDYVDLSVMRPQRYTVV